MTTPADLRARLPELTLRDEFRLRRRLDAAGGSDRGGGLARLVADVDAAERRIAGRRAAVPAVRYPVELPIAEKKDEILAAIRDHQVVIVAGETGSGKTTQLPKICLELGRGVRGLIGHTQPRRLAARTVAERIAEELDTPLGAAVGFQVRFTDRSSDHTLVKLMTDGILLTEIQHDRMLRKYDTLIIDEAHERSLNIDFILGYVKQLLPRRPDLKVVITSATIDPERFSAHFNGAPIIEVSGRTYPVEVRYRPGEDDESDQIQAISDAVEELAAEGSSAEGSPAESSSAEGTGDILVFLSGEREIRDTADALRRLTLPGLEVLPLYARLSIAEQHRVFQPHPGRRVVLATNVAETSLTVPGIKYVVDPGTARVSRYSQRLKVQRLPIEPVSQASANQRKGRCGRTSDGICIRLYSEPDFEERPEFTDPEILRTNLASVILQMTALGLGDLAAFPFIDPPDRRNITDGVNLLHELGALDLDQSDPRQRLTVLGRRLAQLPIDPRLGRMVLESERNGCVREILVIAAGLSIQDPRERPADRQQAAAEKHARFSDKESDFLAYLNLWNYLEDQQRALSSSAFRRMCRAEFLNYLRVREWQDLYAQLRQVTRTLGMSVNDVPADPPRVHQALLAGLLSHIGVFDPEKRDYLGARGARFAVFPGSALFRRTPRWLMAAELVETSRLWARIVAKIEPDWVEPLAGHLVKRQYSEPHWEKKRGSVVAQERVTLYGVPIVTARTVNFGRIDPMLSRELFIRHALVEGDWDTRHAFFHENRALLDEVEDLEHRVRRRDILVDDETLFDFYDRRVGQEVVSARHFDAWWKRTRVATPDLLTFEKSMLVNERAAAVSADDYPDEWVQDELRLPLTYQFEPDAEADGVTVHIPLPVLNRVEAEQFEWQVPGLREELVVALLRSLPKAVRRNLVPAPDYARAALAGVDPGRSPLLPAIARELHRLSGVPVPPGSWQPDRVPDHLRMTFRVVDDEDRTLAEGKDLAALRERLRPRMRETLGAVAHEVERRGLRTWDIGTLPRTVSAQRAGYAVTGYPALVDDGDSVAVRVLETEAEQWAAMWRGTRRLLLLTVPSPVKLVNARLRNEAKLALSRNPHGSAAALIDDCVACAVDKLMAEAGGPAWDPAGFGQLRDSVRGSLADTVFGVVERVRRILAIAYDLERRLAATRAPALLPALADIRSQLSGLVYAGFVAATGWWRLPDLVRYLRAIERRLDRLPDNPQRDREQMHTIQEIQREYARLRAQLPPSDNLAGIRWMIEELRVNYFAQALGTPQPISDRRIYRAMDDLTGQTS
ncbi:MAG TPA: ATP-dependent RNA helicase HrpA [Micromonosporaceae bacterium]